MQRRTDSCIDSSGTTTSATSPASQYCAQAAAQPCDAAERSARTHRRLLENDHVTTPARASRVSRRVQETGSSRAATHTPFRDCAGTGPSQYCPGPTLLLLRERRREGVGQTFYFFKNTSVCNVQVTAPNDDPQCCTQQALRGRHESGTGHATASCAV